MAAYAFSTVSSTTGTYSTTYKSSRVSVMSSELDLAPHLSRVDLWSWLEDDEEKVTKIERTKRLVKEFCHGGDGDIGALVERWLSEVGVGWVRDLSDDPSAGTSSLLRTQPQRNSLTEKWIRALTLLEGHFAKGEQDAPALVQLARFVEAAVLKMLPFVDALLLASADPDAATDTAADATNGAQAPSERELQTLLDVRDAVFSTSEGIQLVFKSCDCDSLVEMEAQRSSVEVLSLLSAKKQRLDEVVWNTMEEVRTSILNNDDDNEWGIQTRQGSPDICKVTRSLVTYIKCLTVDYWRVNSIVRTAAKLGNYVPPHNKTDPVYTLMVDTVSSLQVRLAKRSESFPDHSLRFLFLINNTQFIWQQLHSLYRIKYHVATLTPKIEDYIQKYLQVSWEPVLSCLHNDTPRCFRTNSALPKFDSEFQKIYTAQKLWKVPDPKLRTRLREAIVEKVVSGLTSYLEDNNVTNPGVTPQEREEMLMELFEG
ncbi:unnamed protein product [Urochloa decumbens]|uniref:Exocyst subunit Exo70 family protein n=1 Tax=Urochloa decumbens TaxID=240449 RepID=A0ABC9B2I5_9POAL